MATRLLVSEDIKEIAVCSRCQNNRASVVVHDARGCVYLCRDCRAWREGQPPQHGHAEDCPTGGAK